MRPNLPDRAVAAGYTLGWTLLKHLPDRTGRWVFARIADYAWRKRLGGVCQLEANLRRLVGPTATQAELRALSRASMRSYFRYWYELFRLPAMDHRELVARTRCNGLEILDAQLRAGRGVVAALPHMGNWDQAGAWITLRGIPLTTVAERLRPESLFQRFTAVRVNLGMEVLPLSRGAGTTVGTLARRLRAGRLVCLLADRDLTGQGIEVDFFGESARMPAGPAALALATGAALLPVSLWFDGPHWGIRIHEEIRPPSYGDRTTRIHAMTQELAYVFEQEIAAHPEDWHMMQPVFTADLTHSRGEVTR